MNLPTNAAQAPIDGSLAPFGASALSDEDLAALERALRDLESSSLAMRLNAMVGRQIGVLGSILPTPMSDFVNKSAEAAIRSALALAVRSLDGRPIRESRRLHKATAALAGAAGGALGFSGLPVELPFTTTLMLRSIAAIARNEGEDLARPEAALACLAVFALGGRDDAGPYKMRRDAPRAIRLRDDADAGVEGGYFAVRGLLAKAVSEAARYLVERGLGDEAAPILVRLVTQISARFGFVVSQKLAAQSVPIIGAACGAAINYAFVDHFQTLARGHFTISRLERRYGASVVRAEYDQLLRRA